MDNIFSFFQFQIPFRLSFIFDKFDFQKFIFYFFLEPDQFLFTSRVGLTTHNCSWDISYLWALYVFILVRKDAFLGYVLFLFRSLGKLFYSVLFLQHSNENYILPLKNYSFCSWNSGNPCYIQNKSYKIMFFLQRKLFLFFLFFLYLKYFQYLWQRKLATFEIFPQQSEIFPQQGPKKVTFQNSEIFWKFLPTKTIPRPITCPRDK